MAEYSTHSPNTSGFKRREVIREGGRSDALTEMAGELWPIFNFNLDMVRQGVLDFNTEYCRPPLSEDEIDRTILSSAAKWPKVKRPPTRQDLDTMRELFVNQGYSEKEAKKKVKAFSARERAKLATVKRGLIPFLSFDELMALPDPTFLIDGVLVEGSLAVLSAPQSHYKSFLALDMACAIATGREWAGHPSKEGDCLYVCAEGSSGIRKRLAAWALFHDAKPERLTVIPRAIQMMSPADVDDLLSGIQRTGKRFGFVVVDTLSRTMAGHDENQQKDMSGYVQALERLQRETGATVLVIHHHNREGKIRGSSVLSGAIDTEMSLRPFDDQTTELFCLKQKDFEYFPSHYFQRHVIQLPGGGDSLVFEMVEPKVSTRTSERPTANEAQALAELARYPSGRAIQADWAKVSRLSKSSFYNAVKGLVAKGLVEEDASGLFAPAGLLSKSSPSPNQSNETGGEESSPVQPPKRGWTLDSPLDASMVTIEYQPGPAGEE